jgi:hypothetical protein
VVETFSVSPCVGVAPLALTRSPVACSDARTMFVGRRSVAAYGLGFQLLALSPRRPSGGGMPPCQQACSHRWIPRAVAGVAWPPTCSTNLTEMRWSAVQLRHRLAHGLHHRL